jgi:hypothetical protein
VLFSGLIRINAAAFNTASPDTFTLVYNNGGTWTRTAGQTQVNNTQYNVSGVLTTMPNNTFRTDYVYLLPNNPSKLYVVMGTDTYGSLTLAKGAPRPSSLPVELQVLGLEVGRLFIEKNSSAITEVQSSFANDFVGASVPEHNSLSGLQGGAAGEYNHLTDAQVALVNTPKTLQYSYDNSTPPQITTTTGLGAVTIQRGSASDTDNIIVGKNGVGITTFTVKGEGDGYFNRIGIGATSSAPVVIKTNPTAASLNIINRDANDFSNISFFDTNGVTGLGAIGRATGRVRIMAGGLGDLFERLTILDNGHVLINKTTDDGDYFQVNGGISATTYTGGATLTGTPTAPTATVGTNTTQIATTAFGFANFIALSGNQTFTGIKSATNTGTTQVNGILLTNNATGGNGQSLIINNNQSGVGQYVSNSSSGKGLYIVTTGSAGTGLAVDVAHATGKGIYMNNGLAGVGIDGLNQSSGKWMFIDNMSTGQGIVINNRTEASGKAIQYTKNSVEKMYLNDTGDIFAQKIISNDVVRLKNYTVATLPAGTQGDTAYVTDATAPTYLGTLTGGGSVVCPVFYNGTTWVSH